MTVKELKEAISDLPDDMEVIMQSDAEGNNYSPLSCCDSEVIYVARETWYGEVYSLHYSADDNGMDDDYWEHMKKTKPRCLVLAPVN